MVLIPELSADDTVSAAVFQRQAYLPRLGSEAVVWHGRQMLDKFTKDAEAGVVLDFVGCPLYLFPPSKLSPTLRQATMSKVPETLIDNYFAVFAFKP